MESEFGRGLVYNLVLFANHFSNEQARKIQRIHFVMSKPKKERDKILVPTPDSSHDYGWNSEMILWYKKLVPIFGSAKKALSHEIEMWANGATDHLYEIEVPKKFEDTNIAELVKILKEKGLKIGHGFADTIWKHEDFLELIELTKTIAIEIDKKIGVDVVKGRWE